jgi:hypothetical protein
MQATTDRRTGYGRKSRSPTSPSAARCWRCIRSRTYSVNPLEKRWKNTRGAAAAAAAAASGPRCATSPACVAGGSIASASRHSCSSHRAAHRGRSNSSILLSRVTDRHKTKCGIGAARSKSGPGMVKVLSGLHVMCLSAHTTPTVDENSQLAYRPSATPPASHQQSGEVAVAHPLPRPRPRSAPVGPRRRPGPSGLPRPFPSSKAA